MGSVFHWLDNELRNIILQQLDARDLSCVSSVSREFDESAKDILLERAVADWWDPADAFFRTARYIARSVSRRVETWAPVASGGLESSFFVNYEGMVMESTDSKKFVCTEFEAMRGIRVRNVAFRGGMWAAVSREGDRVYTCNIDTFASSVPPVVTAFVTNRVASVSAGSAHCLCVGEIGEMFSWGNDYYGQCGHGSMGSVYPQPRCVQSLLGLFVRNASAGDSHSVVVTEDGAIYSFGCGEAGRLGHGPSDDSVDNYASECFPRKVVGFGAEAVRCIATASGNMHSLALTRDGMVFAWGDNRFGQLGLPDNVQRSDFPEFVMDGGQYGVVCRVCAGQETSFVITEKGKLLHWGVESVDVDVFASNGVYEDIRHCVYAPTVVYAFDETVVVAVSSSFGHTIAVTRDGHAYGCHGSVHGGVSSWGMYDDLLL
jgi:hypothetical protein